MQFVLNTSKNKTLISFKFFLLYRCTVMFHYFDKLLIPGMVGAGTAQW